MLLHHAATTVINVINLHCRCATERSQGMPLCKLLTTSMFFVRSYIHKAQHTKRGTKSVRTGQVHLGLEPNKRTTWTTLGLGFLPFGRTQEFTNRTHLLCLQANRCPIQEKLSSGLPLYVYNVKSIEPCLQFRDMRTPCSLSPCHPWHSIVLFKLLPTLGEVPEVPEQFWSTSCPKGAKSWLIDSLTCLCPKSLVGSLVMELKFKPLWIAMQLC